MLVAATGARLWETTPHAMWSRRWPTGGSGLAISLTTFVRRPEYLRATGAPRPRAGDTEMAWIQRRHRPGPLACGKGGRRGGIAGPIDHSLPSYLVFVAANRWIFSARVPGMNAALPPGTILASCASWVDQAREQQQIIIVAAGRGRRLGRRPRTFPSAWCAWQASPSCTGSCALCTAGLSDIVVVRGYLGDRIDGGAWRLLSWTIPTGRTTTSWRPLLCAEHCRRLLLSYCDIVYTPTWSRAGCGRTCGQCSAGFADHRSLLGRCYEGRTCTGSEAELTKSTDKGRSCAWARARWRRKGGGRVHRPGNIFPPRGSGAACGLGCSSCGGGLEAPLASLRRCVRPT